MYVTCRYDEWRDREIQRSRLEVTPVGLTAHSIFAIVLIYKVIDAGCVMVSMPLLLLYFANESRLYVFRSGDSCTNWRDTLRGQVEAFLGKRDCSSASSGGENIRRACAVWLWGSLVETSYEVGTSSRGEICSLSLNWMIYPRANGNEN